MAMGTHFFRDVFLVRSPLPPFSGRFSWFVISSDVADEDWPPSAATGDFLPPSLDCLGVVVDVDVDEDSLAVVLGLVVTFPCLSNEGQSPILASSGSYERRRGGDVL